MRAQVAADLPFERYEQDRETALAELEAANQGLKVEIIRDLPADDGTVISFYRHGTFTDLCRGPHVASTGKLGPFKLLNDRRRLLARRRDPADAPADLRHGLGVAGRP